MLDERSKDIIITMFMIGASAICVIGYGGILYEKGKKLINNDFCK